MALFAAYENSIINDEKACDREVSNEAWLSNSSFQIQVPQKVNEESVDSLKTDDLTEVEDSVPLKIPKKSKAKKLKSSEDEYFIDKKPTREFLTVKTISRPTVARYKIHYYLRSKKKRSSKFRRYFQIEKSNIKDEDGDSKKSVDREEDSTSTSFSFDSSKHEIELTQSTAFYNKTVFDEPNNVEMWLKFIDFQDTVFKFEKTFKKGSIAKGLRANAERKLDILEKAFFHNPHSEDLQRKRLHIMVTVYPADELQKQLKELLQKNQGNIILWQGYIEATQCSMSHCNTGSVLKLYTNCLSTLHKLRRNAIADSRILEESILRILYQCGLFLKQSGLFEQLWTLLKMYLEMNLGQMVQNSFDISSDFNEKQLLELEELVFESQLPSHELWLRTEKLRESCHWLPVTQQCEDPQRIVFTDDVVELIQPITVPENTFRLTATVLTLLKVPLLPCRHNTTQQLGLDYVPWALDSIETLLPIFFSVYPINLELENFLIDHQLSVGPQYLKLLPGQEEYLGFILKVMQKCIDYLQGEDKLSLIIWWFRFQNLLVILDSKGILKLPPNFKKNMKSNIKTLLKKSENRSNILFYVEYALIEKELNCKEDCLKILDIALNFVPQFNPQPKLITFGQESVCYLVRVLVETSIHIGQTEKALKYLVNFVLGKSLRLECALDENTLTESSLKFKHITLQLLSQAEFHKLPPVKHMLPIFLCDWLKCHSWFIYITKGPLDCGIFLEDILEKLEEKTNEKILQVEIIYEYYVAVMLKFCLTSPGFGLFRALDDILHRALVYFPNNLFLLSVVAKEQFLLNSLGPKFWKIKDLLVKSGHALPILILIFITHGVVVNLQGQLCDNITGDKMSLENTNFKNIMLSLFRNATKTNMCTRRCGLVWRLYLQFIHKYFDSKFCRKIYYCAVEECPWLKALYIDAAIYIPAELGQIQDLLVEKQLRIHITPEELDILRE